MIQEINTTKSEKLQANFELQNLLKEKQNKIHQKLNENQLNHFAQNKSVQLFLYIMLT
ncbi:unnamed protein product [Paramecium octaurelia]|uniref:Uncharacterized protein n=1 Tax=Paramecium octaurelia TaxID=43137 RepID=A0A8S1XUV5_PAROT|nr:unnamed protein product [Paramecium octaurelia]